MTQITKVVSSSCEADSVQKYINRVHTWLLIDSTWTLGEAIVEEFGVEYAFN